MKLLENILRQNANLLQGKLVYIYSGKNNCKLLYQDLIDSNILYFYDSKLTNIEQLQQDDMVRIVSKNKEFARFDKQIVHRRFAPTFKKKEHAGRALKCTQIKNSERNSVEMMNHYSENRRAIVRRSIDFEVG